MNTPATAGKALIVENYSDLAMLVAATMKQRNYRCDTARDFATALDFLKANRYDSIVIDVSWPVVTNEVLSFLEKEQRSELKKVIVMTAFDPAYLGFDELSEICTFLRKPFGIDELLERLAHCADPIA